MLIKIETCIDEKKYWETTIIDENNRADDIEFNVVRIYPEIAKQQWLGMGGALTEASIHNFTKLSYEQQDAFLNSYYSKEGLNYNWGRISIGSNDFSLASHEFSKSYDKKTIIPFIQKIYKIKDLTLVAVPWTPPVKFKDNQSLVGGKLRKECYDEYAEYLIDFLNFYKENGIKIQYLSIQNEPFANQSWESCVYTEEELKNFTYQHLLSKLTLPVKVLVWDHNKENLFDVSTKLVSQNKQIGGIAYHWYTGLHSQNVNLVHQKYPDKLLIQTEGCCGFSKYNEKEWVHDAELLLEDLISDMNNGMNAYIDWNILLDYEGGPNHQNNFCKSPIILNKKSNDYLKTPIYYYFGHVSKFISPNSKIVESSSYTSQLFVTAAVKNHDLTIVFMNKSTDLMPINVVIGKYSFTDLLKPHSIVTYLLYLE